MIPRWLRLALLLAVTLAAGIAIGVVHGHPRNNALSEMVMGTTFDQDHVMAVMEKSLDLDSTQHKAMIALLHRHQAEIDSVWNFTRPHVMATMQATHRDILALLRPEQREKFLKLIHGMHSVK